MGRTNVKLMKVEGSYERYVTRSAQFSDALVIAWLLPQKGCNIAWYTVIIA